MEITLVVLHFFYPSVSTFSRAARQSVWINGDSYLQPVRLERQPGTRERMVQGADSTLLGRDLP